MVTLGGIAKLFRVSSSSSLRGEHCSPNLRRCRLSRPLSRYERADRQSWIHTCWSYSVYHICWQGCTRLSVQRSCPTNDASKDQKPPNIFNHGAILNLIAYAMSCAFLWTSSFTFERCSLNFDRSVKYLKPFFYESLSPLSPPLSKGCPTMSRYWKHLV